MRIIPAFHICIALSFLGCDNNEEIKPEKKTASQIENSNGRFDNNGQKIGFWKYNEKGIQFEINWEVGGFDNVSVIKPKEWEAIDDSTTKFIFRPTNDASVEFIVFLEFQMTDFTLKEFVKAAIEKSADSGVFTLISLHKITLGNEREVYILYHDKKDESNEHYRYSSMFTQSGNEVYDFTMKTNKNNHSEKQYIFFEDMIESLTVNGEYLTNYDVIRTEKVDINSWFE